jgi:hypothetical protein
VQHEGSVKHSDDKRERRAAEAQWADDANWFWVWLKERGLNEAANEFERDYLDSERKEMG